MHFCDHGYVRIRNFAADLRFQRRVNVKCCVKLGKSLNEALGMLQKAYYKEAVSQARCFEWHLHFKRSRSILTGGWREVRVTLHEHNPQKCPRNRTNCATGSLSRKLLTTSTCRFGTVQAISTRTASLASWWPGCRSVKVRKDIFQQALDDQNFMSRVITGDELGLWLRPIDGYSYDP